MGLRSDDENGSSPHMWELIQEIERLRESVRDMMALIKANHLHVAIGVFSIRPEVKRAEERVYGGRVK